MNEFSSQAPAELNTNQSQLLCANTRHLLRIPVYSAHTWENKTGSPNSTLKEINQSRARAQPIWCYAQNQEKGKQMQRLLISALKVTNTLQVGRETTQFAMPMV